MTGAGRREGKGSWGFGPTHSPPPTPHTPARPPPDGVAVGGRSRTPPLPSPSAQPRSRSLAARALPEGPARREQREAQAGERAGREERRGTRRRGCPGAGGGAAAGLGAPRKEGLSVWAGRRPGSGRGCLVSNPTLSPAGAGLAWVPAGAGGRRRGATGAQREREKEPQRDRERGSVPEARARLAGQVVRVGWMGIPGGQGCK